MIILQKKLDQLSSNKKFISSIIKLQALIRGVNVRNLMRFAIFNFNSISKNIELEIQKEIPSYFVKDNYDYLNIE